MDTIATQPQLLKKPSSRNGEIDFLKFCFSLVVVFYHARVQGGILENGALAVEFFFLVTGFYFIPSVQRFHEKQVSAGASDSVFSEGIKYVWSRIKSIGWLWILTLIWSIGSYTYVYIFRTGTTFSLPVYLLHLSRAVWTALFLDAGVPIEIEINLSTWYLSAMFITMLIFYPIVVKHKNALVKYIGPLVSLYTLAMIAQSGAITKSHAISQLRITTGLCRAIMGILLGCILYEISLRLKKINFTVFSKLLFNGIAYAAIFFSLVVMQYSTAYRMGEKYDWLIDFSVIPALAVAVLIIGSKLTVTGKLFQNPLCGFLGQLSTAIFLVHLPFRAFLAVTVGQIYTPQQRVYLILICGVALALIFTVLVALLKRIPFKKLFEKIGCIFVKKAKSE